MKNSFGPSASQIEEVSAFLREHGFLTGDAEITQDIVAAAYEEKKLRAYHNTQTLLSNYRTIIWQAKSEVDTVAAELDLPLRELDAILSRIDAEVGMDKSRIQFRLNQLEKTRSLVGHVNEALTLLQSKPDDGKLLYDIIYLTYISEERLHHIEILDRLNLSDRHYYRLKKKAISFLSLRLWAAPSKELEIWMGLVSMYNK